MTAEQRELIAAAVDGELSATEARAFRQLLSASAEARALYAKLKADGARLRALARPAPAIDLRAKIMARIAAITPAPTKSKPAAQPVYPAQPAQPVPTRRGAPAWVPVAVAAGVMLCITAGSFAFFSNQHSPPKATTAKNPWSNALPPTQSAPTFVPSPTAPSPRDLAPPDANAVAHIDVTPVPALPVPKVVTPGTVAVAPEPRVIEPDLIGARPLPPLPPFNFVEVRVPFLRTVAELEREDRRQELTDELRRDSAYRFDLFVRDTARGIEVFQNAAKVAGLTTFTDATALDRLKKKQVSSVVIYTESLTAAELAALFSQVSIEDAKFSPRICDSLHAAPVGRTDELELKATLGFDAGLFKRPTSGTPRTSDKPVSASTINDVVKSVTNTGDKTAVLLAWHPANARTNPSMSAELKQFHSKRGDRKPAAIPAIIVIRPVG